MQACFFQKDMGKQLDQFVEEPKCLIQVQPHEKVCPCSKLCRKKMPKISEEGGLGQGGLKCSSWVQLSVAYRLQAEPSSRQTCFRRFALGWNMGSSCYYPKWTCTKQLSILDFHPSKMQAMYQRDKLFTLALNFYFLYKTPHKTMDYIWHMRLYTMLLSTRPSRKEQMPRAQGCLHIDNIEDPFTQFHLPKMKKIIRSIQSYRR